MAFFSKITRGLAKSRDKFKDSMYALIGRGPDLDDDFWDELEETLVLSDIGGRAAMDVTENLRKRARKLDLPDAYAVLDMLSSELVDSFADNNDGILDDDPQVVLFVGINGTGKTTTVGKIAKSAADAGRKVILGSADTFRAAAMEQLEEWAHRADVPIVARDRGSDPASVCFETIDQAQAIGADLVLIDTAGRLHTSDDLMRELVKVVNVTRKRAEAALMKVYTVLIIDATTGQNGMQQAREFDRALDLDGIIVTKLDGTAKGGIALAISHELNLPICRIGVGEAIDDLRDFDARDFVKALIGDYEDEFEEDFEDDSDDDSEGGLDVARAVTIDVFEEPAAEGASTRPASGQPAQEDGTGPEPIPSVEPVLAMPQDGREAAAGQGKPGQEAPSKASGNAGHAADTSPISEGDGREGGSEQSERKMSWAEFVELDEADKAKRASSPKKHFWEKW